MTKQIIRAFIAVPLSADLRTELTRRANGAFADIPHLREVTAKSMHLTLKFLGETDAAAVAEIGARLKEIAARHEPFRLRVEGVGGFPDLKLPRVIFAPLVGETERLIALASDLDKLASRYGIAPEGRPFSPHLTLVRVKAPKQMGLVRKRIETLEGVVYGECPVEEIVLYRSDLRPEGARYTPLHGARLGVIK